MLKRCQREQWSIADLDWSKRPRPMSREDEMAIVQLYYDMSGIERLAGALFHEQARRTRDPTLRAIFESFIRDEIRHSQVAQMLADFYDVHRYKVYRRSPSLDAFLGPFIDAIAELSDEVANLYITSGELILDIALLRSVTDYVADEMSAEAMKLINRDESRHVAIDYYMTGYYASPEYRRDLQTRPATGTKEWLRAARTFARVLYYAQPFIRDVFFVPMARVDPSGRRLREAFKRIQLLEYKEEVALRPFIRFLQRMQDLYHHKVVGPIAGGLIVRIVGVGPQYLARLYSDAEMRRARSMSYEELAAEALAVKEQPV